MAIQYYDGSMLKGLYCIGFTSNNYPYPYIVHQGNGKKIFQPGTTGGIITNAYPRSIIGGSSIHRISDYKGVSADEQYYTTATTVVTGSEYPSNFNLGFTDNIKIPTETRCIGNEYYFYGAKPLDISIVSRVSITTKMTFGGQTFRAAGWKINYNVSDNTKYLDKAELWVFIRNVNGLSVNVESVHWPSIKQNGTFNLQTLILRKTYSFNNKACQLYSSELLQPGSAAFIGMPIIKLSSVSTSYSRVMEVQYMLSLKNSTA